MNGFPEVSSKCLGVVLIYDQGAVPLHLMLAMDDPFNYSTLKNQMEKFLL
jgi:hypothetical protein